MYHRIVEGIVRKGFKQLSSGEYEPIVSMFAPHAHFRFFGDHAMGADLHEPSAIRLWFQRILRLFPGIQFEVQDVQVSGTPWNTMVVTQLAIHAKLRDGEPYHNTAMQMVRLSWGRIMEDFVYEDTQVLITALNQIGLQGVQEAVAQPIMDTAA
jgi:ketosteroid isomerase-like protein